MKKVLRPTALTLLAQMALLTGALADDPNILVQRYTTKIETHQTFLDKTVKEAGSPEGKAIIGAAASYFGVPPAVVGLALAAGFQKSQNGEEYHQSIKSPPGYTICYAKPIGTIYNGVESTEDSTFNAVIFREPQLDGLGMYMAVPNKVGKTVRVMSTYDVAFVNNPPGIGRFQQCQATGTAAWLSRNNNTRIAVPKGQY